MKYIRSIARAFFSCFHMDVKRAESEAAEYGYRIRRMEGIEQGWDPKSRSWRPISWKDIK
jgi:hypothetical protein